MSQRKPQNLWVTHVLLLDIFAFCNTHTHTHTQNEKEKDWKIRYTCFARGIASSKYKWIYQKLIYIVKEKSIMIYVEYMNIYFVEFVIID